MKQQIIKGMCLTLLAALGVSCAEDFGGYGSGSGHIAPLVGIDTETTGTPQTLSRADGTISREDLSLRLTKADGSYTKTWDKLSDFSSEEAFPVGDYTLAAFYGNPEQQGFELPAYYGEQTLKIADGETTSVALTASLANSMFSITYTDTFKEYMQSWSASLLTGNGQIDIEADENRPVYVTSGEVTVKVSVTKPSGLSATFEVAKVTANPRYHYHVNIDVNNGNVGDASLTVTFDETLNQETVDIDISDKLLTSAAPELDAEGFTPGEAIGIIEGFGSSAQPKVNIVAMAGIASVELTTKSASLIKQGWPETIELLGTPAADQAVLTKLGLNVLGLWKTPGEMAVVDFSGVLANIKADPETSTNEFTITVKDKLSRTCDPVTLSVDIEEVELELTSAGEYFDPGHDLKVNLGFNGTDVQKSVKIEYFREAANRWGELEIKAVSEGVSRGMSDYVLTLATPAIDGDLKLRASCAGKVSSTLTVASAPFSLVADVNDVFATKAHFSMAARDGKELEYASAAKIMISTDGDTYTESTATREGDLGFNLNGLTPGTTYYLKANIDGLNSSTCVITTEEALPVPNGNFEDVEQTLSETVNMSGEWSISAGVNYQSTFTFAVNEAKGWASINSKTTSGNNRNSWFTIPSTYSTSSTFSSYAPKIKVVNTGGWEGTPDSFDGFTAYEGENSMVIRSVAWDANGTTPSLWRKSFISASEHYNHNTPTLTTRSAGRLFLGSYSYNGTDNFNEGVSFASRPASLKGYYRYSTEDSGEKASVIIKIMNGSNVVATATAELEPAADFTEFTVPISYPAGAAKATSLCVMFASSNRDEASIATQNKLNVREAYSIGATLVVDNLTLTY